MRHYRFVLLHSLSISMVGPNGGDELADCCGASLLCDALGVCVPVPLLFGLRGISFFFFGGLAIPLTQAIFAHLFSYNMQWAATKKEVERSNFFKEIPKIAKRCALFWSLFYDWNCRRHAPWMAVVF